MKEGIIQKAFNERLGTRGRHRIFAQRDLELLEQELIEAIKQRRKELNDYGDSGARYELERLIGDNQD